MMRSIRFALPMVLLLAGSWGCKQGPVAMAKTAEPVDIVSRGWNTYTSENLSVSVPANFLKTPRTAVSLNLGGEEDRLPSGQTVPYSPSAEQKDKGIMMVLYDTNVRPIPGEPMTRMEVRKESGYPDQESVAEELKRLQSEKAFETVELPIGPAVKVETTSTSIGGDEIYTVLYGISHNGDMYVFKFESTNQGKQIGQTGAEIMPTVRLQ